ncbi:MAG: isoprenylcysteine carboxylmethyltransferase family protein [Deltaproteobacteria bacterium]|nr:isoprenylcysteine carboxylmethyltransferase family protein [Deltaproteobacteria bacterium]
MQLKDRLAQEGAWLFRFRSFLPFLLLPILLVALSQSEMVEQLLGEKAEDVWEGFCLAISLLGVAIRAVTIGYAAYGTSGRNTKRQRADALNTAGIYAVVRHPLYLGNFCIFLGVVLLTQVWWFAVIGILSYWLYYERIILAEEAFLRERFGEAYESWASDTPIFVPRISRWKHPDQPFGLKTVLKRETSTLFATVLSFTLTDIGMDLLGEGHLKIDAGWMGLLGAALLLYLAVRFLRKRTSLLDT